MSDKTIIVLKDLQVQTVINIALNEIENRQNQIGFQRAQIDILNQSLEEVRDENVELNDIIRTLTSEVKYYQDLAKSTSALCDAYEKRLSEEAEEVQQAWWTQQDQDAEYIESLDAR